MSDHQPGTNGPARPPHRRVVAGAAGVVVLLVAAMLAVGLRGGQPDDADDSAQSGASGDLPGGDEPDEPQRAVSPGPLTVMAPAPLDSVDQPVTAWTGSELLVIGGTVDTRCPGGGTTCDDRIFVHGRDGAAYDPETDTWRPIARAPAPIDERQYAVWTGSEVLVAATTGMFAFDPAKDTWRSLEARAVPPTSDATTVVPVVTPEGIVYPIAEQPTGDTSLDLILDLESGTFSSLPRDPFGASFERTLAWDGERLWLLSTALGEPAFSDIQAFDATPARLAVLEGGLADGTWRVVEEETPPMSLESVLWWCEDRLVVDPSTYQEALTYDPDAGTWDPLASQEASRCALSAIERDGLAGAGVSDRAVASRLPDDVGPECPFVRTVSAYLWTGDDLLVWDASTTLGCRTGGPPGSPELTDPCPDRLVADGRTRFGFGRIDPAARAPSLPPPDAAYLCRYVPYGPPPSIDGAYTWESDLCCEAIPLTDAELARLTEYLADLAPPPADRSCRADRLVLTRQARVAAPRYLVTLRTGDDLTGVVLDDFGCGHVRLTDDPFELEPGTHTGSGGVQPGVLQAPPDLVDRLFRAMRLSYGQVQRRPPAR